MKHYYLTLFLCLLALGGHAQVAPFGLTVISQETPAGNDLSFQVLAVAHSTGPATYHVRLESPTFTLTNALTAPAVQQVAAGDTLRTTVTASYDPGRVPFALEKLQVELLDPADNVLASVPAFVYFTPYKTVELWNRYDLDELKRVWDAADPESQSHRVYVDPSSIPLSDLTDDELADPDLHYKFRSIPGLAYAIPMRDTGQDADEDDGDDPNGGGQALLLGRHTWDATITGRILTEQWNGQSKNVRSALDLTVTGIKVEVWDKDGLWDDKLATGYTDDNGNFSIHFRETQGSEGSYLEIYLNIVATTSGGTIRVIRRIGWTREGTVRLGNPIDLHYNTTSLNFGDARPNHDDVKPHLLHYGRQSRNFVTSNVGGVLPNSPFLPLAIMILPPNLSSPQNSAFFLPGGFRNAAGGLPGTVASFYLSNNDCLYIGENEETEETAYHEFGHYAMWHMQNRSWANPLEASFASHSYEANADNPKIAWTEGWADGFALIMDAATERYDGERDFDDSGRGNEIRATLETTQRNVRRNGVINPEFTLTKGFLSEYFIATTLFDLWDGSGTATPTSAAFNDNNPSNAFRPAPPLRVGGLLDEAALSFADLTAPIRNHTGNGSWGIGQFSSAVVQNITEYHRYLLQLHGDCDERRRLSNAFLINRISDFPTQVGLPPDAPIQRLGTDEIQRSVSFAEPRFKIENGAYEPNGTAQFTLVVDKNGLAGAADSYNLAAATATGAGSLSDPLTVRDGAALGLNAGTERGYPGSGQYAPGGSRLDADLCGQMRLTLARDGRLDVGSPLGHTAAAALGSGGLIEAQNGGRIQVRAGSVLTIRRGATLFVRNGSTLTVDGQVRVESGGFLCVETGANLAFSPAAELYLDPAATLGTNPVLNLTSTACTGQLPVCGQLTGGNTGVTNTGGRNEALAFDGGDIVTIANTNSTVNNSMHGEFAIEAFVRADNLNRTGAQTIFSSRHYNQTTGDFDGILFSLYNGGQLLLQLGGANYYDAAAQLPNDFGCHHVAVTRDGQNRVRFYIDGQESAYTPQLVTSGHTTGNLNIGADQEGGNPAEFFQGTVGEVRVWNSWRSATQIREGLTARLVPGQQGGLVAYYDMQDAAGSATLSDQSGVIPAVPGALGTPAGGGTDVPTWVTQCQLSCTVQGNFRGSGPASAWSPADSLNDTNLRRAYGRGQGKLALSVSPNPATATGEVATLHFETRQAGPVRVWVQDLLGAERTVLLAATELAAGPQNLPLHRTTLPPGLYLVLVQSGTHREHIRLQINP